MLINDLSIKLNKSRILTLPKEENMLYYDTFITAILARNYPFLTKTSHSKQKKIHYSANIYIYIYMTF